MPHVPTISLNDGHSIPQLGFGVYQVPAAEARGVVGTALEAGYRSIDTATIYRNEEGVGQAIRDSAIDRNEIFLATKLWNDDQGYDSALRAFDASLGRLGLDHVDLYLIHWPQPSRDRYRDSWRALEKIKADGRARSIGVSNFTVAHLERLLGDHGVVPSLNQIELHPGLPQDELVRFHREHNIVTEAWSPLAQGDLDNSVVRELAAKHSRTPAQVVLRWHMQRGVVAIPKSATPSRIRENIDVFDFGLDDDDMRAIATLNTGKRLGPDPERF
ncbi:aldo/keto reductase [Rhizosaccharibacter radicis]|uniref:Aldo/keto reductase n=1 Tax=Rhizosaccharibacter radicis TaxID=2782605 RepID=A0ABT1W198_9PROT|nr:aldo/keto reductase [Acetobacteraceae bacterium KSS12]